MNNLMKPVIDECIFALIQRLSIDDMSLADLATMDLDSVGFAVLSSMIKKGVVDPEDSEKFLHEYYETILYQAMVILDFSEAWR